MRSDLAELEHKLSAKIDDLQVFLSESLTASNDAVHEQLKDHEHRITAIERAA